MSFLSLRISSRIPIEKLKNIKCESRYIPNLMKLVMGIERKWTLSVDDIIFFYGDDIV